MTTVGLTFPVQEENVIEPEENVIEPEENVIEPEEDKKARRKR